MSVLTKDNHQLTVKVLQHDEVAYDLGYWTLQTRIGRQKIQYMIAGKPGDFTLAKCRPLTILGHGSTIEEIVDTFNEQLSANEELVR